MELIGINKDAFKVMQNDISIIKGIMMQKSKDQLDSELFTPEETKKILKIKSSKTLWKYKNEGHLACVHFGAKILFTRKSINDFIEKFSIK